MPRIRPSAARRLESGLRNGWKLAGEPGFEPRQTESKSVVLPLHHSPTDLPNKFKVLSKCPEVTSTRLSLSARLHRALLLATSRPWQARVLSGTCPSFGAHTSFRRLESPSCRHCERTGRADARPMTGSAKQSMAPQAARWIASSLALLAMTSVKFLAALHARVLLETSSLQRQRAQGMPGALHTRGLVCIGRKHTSSSPQVRRNDPAFPAQWCYGL